MTEFISKPKFFSLIPCAGSGLRAGGGVPKQYQTIAGKAMLLHTLDAFAKVDRIAKTFVVVAPDDVMFAQLGAVADVLFCGGATRADTVKNGLQAMLDKGCSRADWVLVHDAARCLVTSEQINQLIDECENDAVGGLLACPVADTLKSSTTDRVAATVDRTDKWAAQTPQMFRLGDLKVALDQASKAGVNVTDESSAMEAIGLWPKLVRASSHNFKVTYPEDFTLAEVILSNRKN